MERSARKKTDRVASQLYSKKGTVSDGQYEVTDDQRGPKLSNSVLEPSTCFQIVQYWIGYIFILATTKKIYTCTEIKLK
jgi:hypothetical protein